MDPHKRETILQMIQSLWGRQVNSLFDLTDGQFFIHALSLLDQFQTKVWDNPKDRLECTRRFLQDIYGKERIEKYLNFKILLLENKSSSQENVDTELELTKIALVVYGIGVLDKNSRVFVDSALKLPVHMHADIMALIQSVVQAGEVGLLLTDNIEDVLKEPSDLRIGLNPATMLSWLQSSQNSLLLPAFENQDLCLTPSPVQSENFKSPTLGQNALLHNASTSTPKHAKHISFTPLADDKEIRHCKSSKMVHLNTSLSEITSPLRDLSIHVSPSSPLLQFVQSPQVIQKAMIKQKDLEIRKLKQQLNDERYEKDELQDVIREHQSQNVLKDSEIAQLQDRIKSLLAYQTAADELEELKVKYEDLEHEYNKLCMKYKDYESCKENVQFLEKLTDDQREELDKLSSEKKLLELERMKNLTHSKKISQLESQIEHLQLKLKELANCETAWSREKDSLLTNLQMAKDRNESLRQELDVLQANRDDNAQGESMGVVLDLQIQEIRKELESERTGKNSLQLRLDDMLRDISERDAELASLKAVLLQKNSDINTLQNNLKSSESQKNDLMLKIKDEQNNHLQEIEGLHLKQNEVVSSYNEQVVELNSKIQDLQSNFDEILSKNQHLENEATSSNEKLACLQEEIENIEILNKMLMNRLNESENKTATANDLCTDMRKQLEETKKQLDEMRKELEDTRKQLLDTRKHSEDINKQKIEVEILLKEEIATMKIREESLQNELKELENKASAADVKCCDLQKQLEDTLEQKSAFEIKIQEEIVTMKNREEFLQNELKELENKSAVADAKFCDLQKQLEDTLEQKSSLEIRIEEEKVSMKKREESLQNELKELKNKATEAEAKCCDLQNQLEDTLEQKSAFEIKIQEEIMSMKNKEEYLQNELKELENKASGADAKCYHLQKQLEDTLEQKSSIEKKIQEEIASMKNKEQSLQNELKDLEKKAAGADVKCCDLQKQLEDTLNEKSALEIKIQEEIVAMKIREEFLQNELKDLSNKAAGDNAKCCDLQNQLKDTLKQKSALEIKIQEEMVSMKNKEEFLQNELKELEIKAASADAKCCDLQKQLEDTLEQKSSLEKRIQEELVSMKKREESLQNELKELENKASGADVKCCDLQKQLEDTLEQKSTLEIKIQEEIVSMKNREEFLQNELKELENKAAGADVKCCDLQKQLEDTLEKKSALEIKIQKEIVSMKNKEESLQNGLKELENKAAGADAKCCHLQKQLEDTLEQKSSLEKKIEEEIVSMKIREESFQNELKELENKSAVADAKSFELQKHLENTLEQKSSLEKRIQEDIVTMNNKEESLRNEMKELENKAAGADAKCCDLQKQLEDTLSEKSALEIKIQEEIVTMKNREDFLQNELKELENKSVVADAKLCDLQKQLADTLEQKSALEIKVQEEIVAMKKMEESLRNELKELENKASGADAKCCDLQKQLENTLEQKSSLEKRIQEEIVTMNNKEESLRNELKELENKAAGADAKCWDLQKQLENTLSEKSTFEIKLQEEIVTMKKMEESLRNELKELENKAAGADAKFWDLQKQLEDTLEQKSALEIRVQEEIVAMKKMEESLRNELKELENKATGADAKCCDLQKQLENTLEQKSSLEKRIQEEIVTMNNKEESLRNELKELENKAAGADAKCWDLQKQLENTLSEKSTFEIKLQEEIVTMKKMEESLRNELKELENKAAGADAKFCDLQKQLEDTLEQKSALEIRVQEEIVAMKKMEESLRNELKELENKATGADAKCCDLQKQLENTLEQKSSLEKRIQEEIVTMNNKEESLRNELKELENKAAGADAKCWDLQKQLENTLSEKSTFEIKLQEEIVTMKKMEESLRNELKELENKAAGADAKFCDLQKQLEDTLEQKSALEIRVQEEIVAMKKMEESLRNELKELENKATGADAKCCDLQKQLENTLEQKSSLEKRIQEEIVTMNNKEESLRNELKELENKAAGADAKCWDLQKQLENTLSEKSTFEIKLQEEIVTMKKMEESLRNELKELENKAAGADAKFWDLQKQLEDTLEQKSALEIRVQEEIVAMKKMEESLRNELKELENKATGADAKCCDLQKQLENTLEQKSSLEKRIQEEIVTMNNKEESLRNELKELENKAAGADAKCWDLQKQLENTLSEKSTFEIKLQEEIVTMKKMEESLRNELKELENKAAGADAKFCDLQKQLEDTLEQKSALEIRVQEEIVAMKKMEESLRNELKELENKATGADAKCCDLQKQLENTLEQKSSLEKRIQEEIVTMNNKEESLRNELKELENKAAGADAKCWDLQKQLENTLSEKSTFEIKLQEEIVTMKKMEESLRNELKELENKAAGADAKFCDLQKQLEDTLEQKSALEIRVQEEIVAMKKMEESLRNELKELENKATGADAKCCDLQKQLENTLEQKSSLEKRIQEEIVTMNNKEESLRNELKELENKAAGADAKCWDLQKQLENTLSEKSAFEIKIQEEIVAMKKMEESLRNELKELENKAAGADAKFCDLQKQLEDTLEQKSALEIKVQEETVAMKKMEKSLRNELKELENKAVGADAKCCDLQKQLEDTLEQKSALEIKIQEEIVFMKNKEQSLQNELKDLENKADGADAKCCDLQKQLEDTLEQKSAFEIKIQEEIVALKKREEFLQNELKELANKAAKADEKCCDLQKQLENTLEQKYALEIKIQEEKVSMKKREESQQNELKALENKADGADAKFCDLQKQLEDTLEQKSALEIKIQEEIVSLKNKEEYLQNELKELENKAAGADAKCCDLQKRLEDILNEKSAFEIKIQEEIVAMKKREEFLQNELIESENKAAGADAKCCDLQKQCEDTLAQKSALEISIQEEVVTMKNKEEFLQNELKELENKASGADAKCFDLQKQLKDTLQQKSALEIKIQEEIVAMKNKEEFLQNELKKLENKVSGADAKCFDLQKQLEDTLEQKSSLEKRIQEEIVTMNNKEESLQKELKELKNKAAVADVKCCDLQKQLEDTLEQKSALEIKIQEEIVTMKNREEFLQNELKELENKSVVADAKFCDLQKQLADTLEQKSSLEIRIEAEIVSMKKREESLQNELKELKNKSAEAEAKCCDLQNQLEDTLEQKSAFEIKIQEEIVAMKKMEESLRNELKELENKAAGADTKCCDLQKQLEDILEQKSALEIKIQSESISHVGEINFLLKEQNERISKYEEQLAELTSQLHVLQMQENVQTKNFETEMNRYKMNCKTLQEETFSLREREKRIIDECDVKISKARDFCNNTRRQLDESSKKLEDVKKENKHLSEQMERNNKNIQKLKSTNESLNSAIQIERETNSSLKKRMESQELKYEEMRQKLESALKENKLYVSEISRLKTAVDYSDRKIREYKQILDHSGTIHLGDSTHFRKVIEQEECIGIDDSISSLNSHRRLRSQTSSGDDSLHVSSNETIITADQVMLRRDTLASTSDLKSKMSANNLPQTEDRLSLCSVSSAQSIKSRTDVPVVFLPNANSCANEPEDPDFEWDRLNELQRRNTLYLPHMKSAYPIELQSVRKRITDDSIRLSLMPDGKRTASPGGYNTRQKDSKTSRSGFAEPFKSDINNKTAVKRKALPKQSSDEKSFESPPKQRKSDVSPGDTIVYYPVVRTAPVYQRPGPPTPGKQPRRISGRFTPSHGISPAVSGKIKALGSPIARPNPRHTPGRVPSRRSPRFSSHVTESPVSDENDRRQSVAFSIGFTPGKNKGPKGFLQKTLFGSKHKNSVKTKDVEETQSKYDQQKKRKPLGARNFLETGI